MKNLTAIKTEKENKVSDLLKECLVFFAFSNEQFTENKTPLQEGEKYVSLGAGGYIPKGKVEAYLQGFKGIDTWYKASLKANKMRRQNIAYELANHEAYYTNDIEQTLQSLGSDYTANEVMQVYKTERNKWILSNAN